MPYPMGRSQIAVMIDAAMAIWSDDPDFLSVGLFKGTVPQEDTVVIGDLDQPNGTWYDAIPAIEQGERYIGPDGLWRISVPSQQFNYTGASAAEEVTGYFIADSAGLLIVCKMLPVPVTMGTTDDSVVTPPLTLVFPRPYSE